MTQVLRNLVVILVITFFCSIVSAVLSKEEYKQLAYASPFSDYIGDAYYEHINQIKEKDCKERYERILSFLDIYDDNLYHICDVKEYSICIFSSIEDGYIQYCEWKNKHASSKEDLFFISYPN